MLIQLIMISMKLSGVVGLYFHFIFNKMIYLCPWILFYLNKQCRPWWKPPSQHTVLKFTIGPPANLPGSPASYLSRWNKIWRSIEYDSRVFSLYYSIFMIKFYVSFMMYWFQALPGLIRSNQMLPHIIYHRIYSRHRSMALNQLKVITNLRPLSS